ncbi:MAG: leucine-rich repeat domain-containing protein [Oscillospiraceae bacterium]|nr:leucine-rich repeat domain-containing protein [Oscillospiraceae bacterium]
MCDCGHELEIKVLNNGNVVISTASNKSCIKIPDRFMEGRDGISYVTGVSGSINCSEFDINPKNMYLKLDDSKGVIFSKDGKRLMAAAAGYKNSEYKVPAGTEIIGIGAFFECYNIKEITLPKSVKEIQSSAFGLMGSLEKINIPAEVEEIPYRCFVCCYDLKEVYIPEGSKLKKIGYDSFSPANGTLEITIPSFEVEINESAFGVRYKNVKLKSYIKPTVEGEYKNGVCKLTWNEIPNATTYEVYQKLKDGTYKLLKTTKDTSVELKGTKKGYRYKFAVKAIGEINTNCDLENQKHDDYYPEFFSVEGAMSDSVTISVK